MQLTYLYTKIRKAHVNIENLSFKQSYHTTHASIYVHYKNILKMTVTNHYDTIVNLGYMYTTTMMRTTN